MLNLTNLRAAYGESEVLHGLNLNVQPGEIVAIMGRNGMGKTTLMKTMMGIVPTSNGSVTVGGTDVTAMRSHKRVANGIAYVPQGRMIFSAMTVQENVETGLTVTGQSRVPDDIYELFPVLLILSIFSRKIIFPFYSLPIPRLNLLPKFSKSCD